MFVNPAHEAIMDAETVLRLLHRNAGFSVAWAVDRNLCFCCCGYHLRCMPTTLRADCNVQVIPFAKVQRPQLSRGLTGINAAHKP